MVYVSNYMNHHVKPLCDELFQALGQAFCFIQTEEMTAERKALGWGSEQLPKYVKEYAREKELCNQLIMESDIAVIGWSCLPFDIMKRRFTNGKPAFRLSERIYKEGQWKRFSPRGLRAKETEHGTFRNDPVYLLCVGAYTASDFKRIDCYPGKMYRWGYFTENSACDLIQWKDTSVIKLLWAGRLMELKHPEYAVLAADQLKKKGISFELHMVGDGQLRGRLEQMCKKSHLEDQVTFHGAVTQKKVRDFMKEAHIFLFTSNYLEGWGAVVNEAMNSGCCVLASSEAGAVPFLIRDGENGCSYDRNSYKKFSEKLLLLTRDMKRVEEMGRQARQTTSSLWSAECAAKRLLTFSEAVLSAQYREATGNSSSLQVGENMPEEYEKELGESTRNQQEKDIRHGKGVCKIPDWHDDGPLSPAPILKAQSFFRTLQENNRQDNG